MVTAVTGVAVLLAWIPLRNRPGIGTVANVVVIAVTVDGALTLITAPQSLPARAALPAYAGWDGYPALHRRNAAELYLKLEQEFKSISSSPFVGFRIIVINPNDPEYKNPFW